MRLLSGLCGLILLLIAVVFAVANRQTADVNLWPFALGISLPLYLLVLGSMLIGMLLGACLCGSLMVPQRLMTRQLRQDMAGLHDKLDRLHESLPIATAAAENAATDTVPLRRRWRL